MAKSKVGEVKVMHNGLKAEIIEYNSSNDITVQFEDGTVVKSRYGQFKSGHIRNVSVKATAETTKQRLGLTYVMRNGMSAKIIKLHQDNIVDVEFEDGAVVTNVNFYQFKNKGVGHPTYRMNRASLLGETRVMNNGLKATCINYVNANCIDVQFENGVISRNHYKCQWDRGSIGLPKEERQKARAEKHVGMRKQMRNGDWCEIIRYGSSTDIDVKFDTGEILEHVQSGPFREGVLSRPNHYRDKIVGTTANMSNGQVATCIDYRSAVDIDVQFDDGTIVQHCALNNFKRGLVENVNDSARRTYVEGKKQAAYDNCFGRTVTLNNGHTATCIEYFSPTDITIQLDDGTILYHKRKRNFLAGQIGNRKPRTNSK